MRKVAVLTLLMAFLCVSSFAQTVPDFQLIMDTLQGKLDAITVNAWSGGAWDWVRGTTTPPFEQRHPSFPGRAHIGNEIKDDDHLALLQKVLEGDACTRELLGDAFVNNVRDQFFANQALVTTRETYFNLRLWNSSRVSINYIITLNNRSVWTDPAVQTFTTGQANNIRVCADGGTFIGTTCFAETADIPSLWGDDGLMSEAAPGLSDDVRDLLAAYLTIGNQAKVDYMQAVVFQTFYRGVLPNIMALIFNLMSKGLPFDAELELVEPDWDFDVSSKAYTPLHAINDVNIDVSYNPPFVVSQSDPYIAINRAVATVFGNSIQAGVLQHWLHFYTVNGNGFGSGFATRFRASGDLDQNGQTNLTAYYDANFDRTDFLVRAGAGINFAFQTQPLPASQTINYGGQAFFSAGAIGGSGGPITYQWYAGPTPGTLQPVVGATGTTYNPVINIYSFGATTNSHYYRCVASTHACGETISHGSNSVQVVGGAPPAINIFDQPAGGSFQPGAGTTLAVNAGVAAGSLTYQWQKYDEDFENWMPVPGATSNQLVFGVLGDADAGTYRCQIYNKVGSNPLYWTFSSSATLAVAPAIVIDPQPVGTELNIGGNYTLVVAASVADGNLEYRWQRNPGTGFQNLTGWVDAGATSFTTDWPIVGATLADSGTYRLQVRNTLAPFGTYQRNSAGATVNVSSGNVVYVDPTGDNTDGKTWATAFWTLQDGIEAAAAGPDGGEVWVAGGPIGAPLVYNEPRTRPWGGNVGDAGRVVGSLIMRSNVGVYGGFEGYRDGNGRQETNRLQRNRAQNIAVIDGSTSRGGSPAYHVVVFGGMDAGVPVATTNSVLDGFVITGGNAAGIANDYHSWRGGGIYNFGSAPTIANCIIKGNRAAVSGGGVANEASSMAPADATIVNCLIYDNVADRVADGGAGPGGGNPIRGGGAVFNNLSSATLNFVTVVDNAIDSTYNGGLLGLGLDSGGIYTWHATPLVSNAIVWDNTGGIRHDKPASLATQDTTVMYTDVQGGYAGTGNLNVNPQLGNAAYTALLGAAIGNYVPAEGSPVLNVGDPNITGGDDLLGVLRPLKSAIVDMGAFELSLNGPSPACLSAAVDITIDPTIADPFDVYDAENSTFEAPIWNVTLEAKVFDCADITNSDIELTAMDILGRTGTCVAPVTVTESEDPVVVTSDIDVDLDASGSYTLTPADVAALTTGTTDNCTAYGDLTITVVPNTFTCAQAGQAVQVSVFVEDEEGNSATATAVVSVWDNVAPTPQCGSISVNLLPNGTRVLSAAEIQSLAAGTTDNCAADIAATTATPSAFTCADIGLNNVTVRVFDVNGNWAECVAQVEVLDTTAPNLTLTPPKSFTTSDADFTEVQALAGVTAADTCDGDLTAAITVLAYDLDDQVVPWPVPAAWDMQGEISYMFTLEYQVSDGSGNVTMDENTLTLWALQLPVITLNGLDEVEVECPSVYVDAGATAYDPEADADITAQMTTTVAVNTGAPGTYTVTYSVGVPGYPAMEPVTATRTVHVVDTVDPVITLHVANPYYWQRGDVFVDPVSASDACAGNLAGSLVITGAVDVDTPGEYHIAYDVQDGVGNVADTVELTVIVGDMVEFTEQPVGGRLYTADVPGFDVDTELTLSAGYRYGFNVAGYEWFRGVDGEGFVADTDSPNTVALAVVGADLGEGLFQYTLVVTDDSGANVSDAAAVEVATPITVTAALNDVVLAEGQNYMWSFAVSGGLGQLSYQWYFSPAGNKAFEAIVDATSNSFAFAPFTAAMAGQYQVTVSDDFTELVVGPATATLDFGVPAAGLFGLAALALATALGGAATLRRRK